jgi:hypothetical protein
VDQVVQVSPEALGPKWLTGNRHRPSGLVWSGEDTLCGGRGDPCRCLNLSTSMGGTRSKVEGEERHDLEPEGTREDTRHKI